MTMTKFSAVLSVLAVAGSVAAQNYSVPAPAEAIALVEAQWQAVGLDAPINNGQSLGQELEAQGLFAVNYPFGPIDIGSAYSADQLAAKPSVRIYPSANANFSQTNSYTLALVDFSSISDPDPEGEYRHYLANGIQTSQEADGSLRVTSGTLVTDYAAPGPLPGTGPHRYAWLMFMQPENFAAPANLSTTGVAPGHWDFKAYVAATNLGNPIAASFFTVENGAPTVAAATTSAVNTATLSVASSAASASATVTTGRGAGNAAASPSTAASPAPTGAASSSMFAPAGVMLAAVAGMVAFLA